MALGLLIAILSVIYGVVVPWVISYSIIRKYGHHKVNYVVAYDFIDMNLTKSEKLIILAIKLTLVLIIFYAYLKLHKINELLGIAELLIGILIVGVVDFTLITHFIKNKNCILIPITEDEG